MSSNRNGADDDNYPAPPSQEPLAFSKEGAHALDACEFQGQSCDLITLGRRLLHVVENMEDLTTVRLILTDRWKHRAELLNSKEPIETELQRAAALTTRVRMSLENKFNITNSHGLGDKDKALNLFSGTVRREGLELGEFLNLIIKIRDTLTLHLVECWDKIIFPSAEEMAAMWAPETPGQLTVEDTARLLSRSHYEGHVSWNVAEYQLSKYMRYMLTPMLLMSYESVEHSKSTRALYDLFHHTLFLFTVPGHTVRSPVYDRPHGQEHPHSMLVPRDEQIVLKRDAADPAFFVAEYLQTHTGPDTKAASCAGLSVVLQKTVAEKENLLKKQAELLRILKK